MPSGLPVSRLINVTLNFTPQPATFPNLSTCLLLGTSDVINITERARVYGSLAAVGLDFSTTDEEYLGALLWFAQRPSPTTLLIGRWASVATEGLLVGGRVSAANQLITAWNAINNGAFRVQVDGVAPTEIGGLNFGPSANLNAVAAVITSGFPGGTAICTWDSVQQRFSIESQTVGAGSSISFLTAPNAGTDISGMLAMLATSSGAYIADGIAAETALAAVQQLQVQFNSQWYGLVVPSADDTAHQAIGSYVEAAVPRHYYGATTQEAGALSAGSTTDLAYLMKALNLDRSTVQYSSTSPYAVISYLSRILTTNWAASNTTITLMFKNEPAVVAETLTETQADALKAKHGNVFVNFNNDKAIIVNGTSASGQYTDSIIGADWLVSAIQVNGFNVLYGTNKVPQTDAGMHTLATAFEAACVQGVANGLLGPGTWDAQGFGQIKQGDFLQKGYYVYQPPIALQLPADRAVRKSVPFQIAAKLAGAVHEADVVVNINQ